MAIFEQTVDINNFIKITQGGIQIATFADIRDTLIKSIKKIFGNDIDVSSATADGQWLNEIALLVNNCLQCVKYSYDMLDPASATGSFLDILCSYNNIKRENQTASKAQILVKNISGVAQNNIQSIQFVDRAGKYWTWYNSKLATTGDVVTKWENGQVQTLVDVTCDELGSIVANGTNINIDDLRDNNTNLTGWDVVNSENNGWIYQTIDFGKWKIYQQDDASVGIERETDESLRSRRIQSSGNQSFTVLSGVEGSLMNISGIKDVWVYDNKSSGATTMDDTSSIPSHSVYVCVRYAENATVDKSIIGSIIYNKLTPGIPSIAFSPTGSSSENVTSGINMQYSVNKSPTITYNIYWKKCQPYQFRQTIKVPSNDQNCWIGSTLYTIVNTYDYPNITGLHSAITDVEKNIAKNLVDYLNNIRIGEGLNATSVSGVIQRSDILKNSMSTFFVIDTSISGAINGILNLSNTYMQFNENNIRFKYGTTSGTYKPLYVYLIGLTLNKIVGTVAIGSTTTITATDVLGSTVTWSSGNTQIATVSSAGVVTGVTVGTTKITASVKDADGNTLYSKTCEFTVTAS